ncbi:MAG: hypothetical protein PHP75_01285 [Methylacidiphilaceae bacterium]|nr:hypothetical protein [Candidatus Methylacidiphilaceae bacterium]
MTGWLQEGEGIAPILGVGFSFSTEWGTLLGILLLLAVQTALAYRRGKVEPLPPAQPGPRPSPSRIPEARPEEPRPELPRGGEPEAPSLGVPMDREKSLAVDEEFRSEDEGSRLRAPVILPKPPRLTQELLPTAAFLRQLRQPRGAREAFLGAEILWNPPMALRDPGAGL